MSKVLVTDGRQRSTLAVVRSLGRKGVDVTVAEDAFPCLASQSRYCHGTFQYPSPLTAPEHFIEEMKRHLESTPYDLVIPMTDVTCYLLSLHKKLLSPLARIAIVDWEPFRSATDKGELVRLCERIDVPTPKTWFLENVDQLSQAAPGFQYPVVIKPRRSKYLTTSGWVSSGVTYAYSLEEVIAALGRWHPDVDLPLIQERVEGPGCGAFYLMSAGSEPVVFFHRRLREKPPSGGVSVLRESIAVDPMMNQYAFRLLQALSWNGVAMVEFKVDSRDNVPKVMEINPRFWGSLQLAIDSGVDFPYFLFKLETCGELHRAGSYDVGVKSRWLLGDFDHLLLRLLKRERVLNLPPNYPSRFAAISEFCRFRQPKMHYEIEDWHDRGPSWFELKEFFRDIFRRK